ncbi:MAG: lipid A deacylase LpxR family protein [Flavobacteriales bacterium]|nr:lipid A deacylase LpxR family protein [Flavobacteriales bacterium]
MVSLIRSCVRVCVFSALLFPVGAVAQTAEDTSQAFTFRYENDFFNATDQYFTQGVQVAYQAPFIGKSPLAYVLLRLKDTPQQHALLLEQQCYTPTSIRRDTIFTGERPFAAALFIGQRRVTADAARGLRLTSVLSLGVLGPCAVCAEEQRGIHEALDNIEPLGWEFQIASDAILNYGAQLEKRIIGLPFAEAALGVSGDVGTYRTNAGLVASLEVGRFVSRFAASKPLDRKFRVSAFGEGQVKLVGYDATLQGGLFNDGSPYTLQADDVERTVLTGRFGVKASYRKFSLTALRTFITREFRTGRDHGWGGFLLEYRW